MDDVQLWQTHARAQAEMTKIPGVVGVGLGIKEVARELCGEVALIVYVHEKKLAEHVAPSERVPAVYEGVKTDVQRYFKTWELGGTTLEGSDQIRRLPDSDGRPKPGTLGYIATRILDDLNVILSCEHVLVTRQDDGRMVFHPDVSRCFGSLKNQVGAGLIGVMGHVTWDNGLGEEDYFVDAAIATIVTSFRKHIPGVGAIVGSGDLSTSPTDPASPTISVKKLGIASALTEGMVDDVAFPFQHAPGGPVALRTIKIRPTQAGGFAFSRTVEVHPGDAPMHVTNFPLQSLGGTATEVGPNQVRFEIPLFGDFGDSGAAIVCTPPGDIVGLLFTGSVYEAGGINPETGNPGVTGIPSGFTIACHIGPVLAELGLRIDPSTSPTAGRRVVVPGDEISRIPPDALLYLNSRLAALERELDASPGGRRLTALIRHHADELMDLVHHRRRVLVAWQRNHGPAFSALLMRALLEPDGELPTSVDGTLPAVMLEAMYRVLVAEGSPSLSSALTENKQLIETLLADSRTVGGLVENAKRTWESPAS